MIILILNQKNIYAEGERISAELNKYGHVHNSRWITHLLQKYLDVYGYYHRAIKLFTISRQVGIV
ncbi:unnamed protein product, partial [Adineta steineri]